MKKSLLFILVCIHAMMGYAQVPTMTWGAEQKTTDDAGRIDRIIGHSDLHVYAVREYGPTTNKKIELQVFDRANFNLIVSSDINTSGGVMGNSYSSSDVLYSKTLDKILVTGWAWNKEDQKVTAGVHVVGATGVWNSNDRIDLIDYRAEKLLRSGNVEFNLSPDGSKLIVLAELPMDKETNEMIKFACYSTSDWSQLWMKDITFDTPDANFKRNDVYVDNEGNGYIVKKNKVKLNRYTIQIHSVSASSKTWAVHDVEMGENQLGPYRVLQSENGDMKLYGVTYPDGKTESSPNGTIQAVLDGGTVVSKRSDFAKDLCTMFMNEKRFLKGKTDIGNTYLRDIKINGKGEAWYFMEQFSESKLSVEGKPGVYRYARTYKDIIVMKLGSDGSFQWASAIGREQKRTYDNIEDDYGHATYALINDEAYVIWNLLNQASSFYAWKTNDGRKMKTNEVFGSNAVFSIFYSKINASGENQFTDKVFQSMPFGKFYKSGFNNPSVNIPNITYQADNELILYAELYPTGLRYQMGKMTITE